MTMTKYHEKIINKHINGYSVMRKYARVPHKRDTFDTHMPLGVQLGPV